MSAIFVSYRRQAALVHARAVFERLSREFGPDQVFIDLEGIDVGVDFVELIEQQLRGCRVLLALIDPEWATAADSKGRRRLELPNDYVRIEVATALRRRIRVVPILIDGAEMPEEEALPDDLKGLARRNALELDFKRFDAEVRRLVAAIRRILQSPDPGPGGPTPTPAAGGAPTEVAFKDPSEVTAEAPPQGPSPAPAPTPPMSARMPAAAPAPPQSPAETAPRGPSAGRRRWFAWAAAAGGIAVVAALIFTRDRPAPVPTPAVSQAPLPASAPSSAVAVALPAATAPAPAPASPGTKPAESGKPRVFRDCPDCPELVGIPAGTFLMGSPDSEPSRDTDEGPQRRVSIGRFAIGKTEVTQGQWRALMGSNPSFFTQCGDDCPVERVSWNDAQDYLRRLSERTGRKYTLPSEAQWEYAARAGTTTPFHTGPTITTEQANFDGRSANIGSAKGIYRRTTVKVGSFAPNGFGLHDVHGNVWEWVQDCYDTQAYSGKAPGNGSAYEVAGCPARVLRGGAWGGSGRDLRVANRSDNPPDDRYNYVGFRVCRASPIE
jgi:formylglycine-generating enzyme required for sulfatase activity